MASFCWSREYDLEQSGKILAGGYSAASACIPAYFGSHYCVVPHERIYEFASVKLIQIDSFYLKLR